MAQYTFDGDFSDSVGANNAAALGNALIVTDQSRGQVLSLDGDDDAVDVPLIGETTEVTVCMWVNPTDIVTPSDWKSTFANNGWAAGDIHWRILNNRINGGVNAVVPGGDLTGGGVVPYAQWSHVAITLSPTQFAYWLNGYNDNTRTLDSAPTLFLGEGLIGAWMNGAVIEREWAGMIDDVRIYDRALSAAEMLWLAGNTKPIHRPF